MLRSEHTYVYVRETDSLHSSAERRWPRGRRDVCRCNRTPPESQTAPTSDDKSESDPSRRRRRAPNCRSARPSSTPVRGTVEQCNRCPVNDIHIQQHKRIHKYPYIQTSIHPSIRLHAMCTHRNKVASSSLPFTKGIHSHTCKARPQQDTTAILYCAATALVRISRSLNVDEDNIAGAPD